MTPEEAITELKESYVLTNGKINGKPLFESIEIAISALEKQVPKKPTRFGSKHIYICPNCARAEYIKRRDALDTHCGFCGQLIDWEDEDDQMD